MELAVCFFFELVNDGLYRGAANSIRGLEFKQYRGAAADHGLHHFGIVHERGLARMQDCPCCDQAGNNDTECKVVFYSRFVGKQNQARDKNEQNRYRDKGIYVGNKIQWTLNREKVVKVIFKA